MNKAKFGPAGTSDSFAVKGYKKSIQMPLYLKEMGLDHFEYQCGRGVKVSSESAKLFGDACKSENISLSLHAPYYISLSSVEAEKRDKSIDYIYQSAAAVSAMGGDRIVVHAGSCGKISREEALSLATDTLYRAQEFLDQNGLSHVHICPETMGKINQLGTLDEVLAMCQVDKRFIPCIDFGHLNARTLGAVNSREAFENVLYKMEESLRDERAFGFHAHFSKIMYTDKGGEKCHLTFEDTMYGPDYQPLMELLALQRKYPVIVCESAGTQAEDAFAMKQNYLSYIK